MTIEEDALNEAENKSAVCLSINDFRVFDEIGAGFAESNKHLGSEERFWGQD